MRQPLWLAIDFDDVTCDFVQGVCDAVSRDFGVRVDPSQVTSWNFGDYIDGYIGRDWWEWLRDHSRLWGEKFKPVSGALGSLEKLRRDGHYLELVTSKPRWAEKPLWDWLGRYEPPFQRVTIISTEMDGGHEMYNTRSKSSVSDADLIIDDRIDNCEDFALDGRDALFFTRPHNAELKVGLDRIIRVANWQEILRAVDLASEGLL